MMKETTEDKGYYKERQRRLIAEHDASMAQADWERYTTCGPLPDATAEYAVNENLTEWRDKPVGSLEPSMDECELAHQLLAELRGEALGSLEIGDEGQAEWQQRLSAELGEVLLGKLDAATADFLQEAESHANAKNECMTCLTQPSCKYGLWVNLAKNPRIKQLDFADLAISTELPKSLALASVAIRVIHYQADRLTPARTSTEPLLFGAEAPLMTLGGVLSVELLGLPPSTKQVKGWTLRQVSDESSAIVRQHYPAREPGEDPTKVSNTGPQLRISYVLPDNVLIPPGDHKPAGLGASSGLRVGWWEHETQKWYQNGVDEVGYEAESRTLSFLTPRLASVAFLQPTDLHLPYKNWLITPDGSSRCRLILQTQRFLLEIEVAARGVTLRAPRLPELAALLDTPMAPTRLLLRLRECGLHLCPLDSDCPLDKAAPKLTDLERQMHEHLAPLVSSLQVAPSRWSQGLGPAKCMYCVAPKKESLGMEDEATGGDGDEVQKEAPDPFAEVDGTWQTILVRHQSAGGGTALVKALDSATSCDEMVLDGMEAHSTPLRCLNLPRLEGTYPDLFDRVKEAPMLYQDTLKQLLNCLRLFSFTTWPSAPLGNAGHGLRSRPASAAPEAPVSEEKPAEETAAEETLAAVAAE